jgi:hypothetical protein
VLSVRAGWGHPVWWALPVLAVGVAFGEKYATNVIVARQSIIFGLTEVFLAVALLLAPGAWMTVAVVVGFAAALATKRRPWLKTVYSLSTFAAASAAAVLFTLLFGLGVAPALCGVLAFAAACHLLVAVAVWLSTGRAYLRVLQDTGLLPLLIAGGNASVGLLGGWLALHEPVGLLGLVIPVGLLWWSYDQQARRVAEARLFEELAHGHEQILGASVDSSAQVVVTAAARMFGGAEVDLLLRHPDGLVEYVGDEHGLSERKRVDAQAFGAPWVLRAMAARGVKTGLDSARPYCSSVLGDHERPLAVLIARRPARAARFTRADEQLARVLASQAESWLSVADLTAQADEARGEVEVYRAAGRVLGDIGAETAPALIVLRESSDRLARLANRFDGPDPVSQIIDELHAVERAVASLLGAIALAQPPESVPQTDSEWTTTGRLEPVDER